MKKLQSTKKFYILQTLKEELQKILPDQLQMQFLQLYEEYQVLTLNFNVPT